MSTSPIHDFLTKYADSGTVRCHMPGHKGREYPADITEISGADSLFESDNGGGIIEQSERNAARIFRSYKTLYSCGGTTLAINAMLTLAKLISGKNEVIASRYSHRAFISSCIHLGLSPVWVYPDEFLSAEVSADKIERLITSDTAAVFVTSIGYYGGMCDIAPIARVCKRHGVPLLIDNAHGAYLAFCEGGLHPLRLGAAMCADSAHKTLPVLTGGAYLHIADKKFAPAAKEAMSIFGSTSPSYLILDSLDKFNALYMSDPDLIERVCGMLDMLKAALKAKGVPLYDSDRMRVTLDSLSAKSSGTSTADVLRQNGIECEYADAARCVLLFGAYTTAEDIKRVYEVLTSRDVFPKATDASALEFARVEKALDPREAFYLPKGLIDINKAVGRICAGISAPCPPGVPLIMPGEIISAEAARQLCALGVKYIQALL